MLSRKNIVWLGNEHYKESKDGTPAWDHRCRPDVMDRYIANAMGWDKDDGKYQAVLNRLIRDLRGEPEVT